MPPMGAPDIDRVRSEKTRSLGDFLRLYNENLPLAFTRASTTLLNEFKSTHADSFKADDMWSLNIHRKKVMDWLSARPK